MIIMTIAIKMPKIAHIIMAMHISQRAAFYVTEHMIIMSVI